MHTVVLELLIMTQVVGALCPPRTRLGVTYCIPLHTPGRVGTGNQGWNVQVARMPESKKWCRLVTY